MDYMYGFMGNPDFIHENIEFDEIIDAEINNIKEIKSETEVSENLSFEFK